MQQLGTASHHVRSMR